VTFIALYIVISRVAIPRTGGAIALRKATVEGDLAQAQKLKADTDKAVQAYEATLAEARARAHGIAQANRDKLAAEFDAERAKLDQALGAKIAEAEKKIAAAKMKALGDVRAVAAELATSIVAELIGAKVTKAAAAGAVANAAK
jgi:F-type H+-transporting ATPase subunit b